MLLDIGLKMMLKLPPELAHELSLDLLNLSNRLKVLPLLVGKRPECPVHLMGLDFPNPVGLAAGMDKNGDHVEAFSTLGFGFVEAGTVTPKSQPGNPKPRMFRIKNKKAIINRMGFNNHGVDYLAREVAHIKQSGVLGINIGKNKHTPESEALSDYVHCLERVWGLADYVAVNISSPNTPGLRDLQFGDALKTLLSGIRAKGDELAGETGKQVPICVKIAPDLNEEEVRLVVQTILDKGMNGLIATNTTLSRVGVQGEMNANQQGGLSGAPLQLKSNEVIALARAEVGSDFPIIGSGGILSGSDAADKLTAGADLIQIYSGFIYQGVPLIHACVDAAREAYAKA